MRLDRLKTKYFFVGVILLALFSTAVQGAAAEQCTYRFDNVILVFDRSGSMLEYRDGSRNSKFVFAGDIGAGIAEHFPMGAGGELFMGLKVFGFYVDDEPLRIRTALARQKMDRELLARTIRGFRPPKDIFGFITPLARSLEDLRKEADRWPGRTAVIIISDGLDTTLTGRPVREARLLREAKNDIVIFTAAMSESRKGRKIMEDIASVGGGKFFEAAEFYNSATRDAALREIFLDCKEIIAEKPKKTMFVLLPDPKGKVGEIIVKSPKGTQILTEAGQTAELDTSERAPRSAAPVNEKKITEVFGAALEALPDPPAVFTIYFDTDSTRPAARSLQVPTEILAAIRSRKSTDITIAGHTDRVASKEYNRKLSRARALAIREILVSRGVDRSNLDIAFYGEEYPLKTTEDNVAELLNRRVEVTVR